MMMIIIVVVIIFNNCFLIWFKWSVDSPNHKKHFLVKNVTINCVEVLNIKVLTAFIYIIDPFFLLFFPHFLFCLC